MVNTLFLPELREMLAEHNSEDLREFCFALHPSRIAEFMDGLTADEAWQVLRHADSETRVQIFEYFTHDRQKEIIETQDRQEVAALVLDIASDERVDILAGIDESVVAELLQRLPAEERRDILRLSQYPDGTAGAVMATEFVRLPEDLTVRQAVDEISRQSETYETIYYLYVVDHENHLRGVVSARQLLAAMRHPETKIAEVMETALTTVNVMDDEEEVVNKVAKTDLLAIPVVDQERHIVGIITHDDVIDVVRETATEDQLRAAGVEPLEDTYLRTSVWTLGWKRGIWLGLLFLGSTLTALALKSYNQQVANWEWLVLFLPLIISTGGNSGSQSSTLIITALSRGHISLSDWSRIVVRELMMGLGLGLGLSLLGLVIAPLVFEVKDFRQLLVLPVTVWAVVICGTVTGSILPLVFKRIGWEPALMSNPFVAVIMDVLGTVIYMNVALALILK
jgi:magnesium transporter